MKLRPLQDRILVKRIEEEEKTAGGIFIPDTAKEKPQMGQIISVGNGKKTEDGRIPVDLKAGDKVLANMGTKSRSMADYFIMREDDIRRLNRQDCFLRLVKTTRKKLRRI
jgi:chaperonin GroES